MTEYIYYLPVVIALPIIYFIGSRCFYRKNTFLDQIIEKKKSLKKTEQIVPPKEYPNDILDQIIQAKKSLRKLKTDFMIIPQSFPSELWESYTKLMEDIIKTEEQLKKWEDEYPGISKEALSLKLHQN